MNRVGCKFFFKLMIDSEQHVTESKNNIDT
jgi:hypothetical protein